MTKHIIICFGDRRRIIALPSSYSSLLKVARKQFPNMGSIYNLVALYQPEDFRGTVNGDYWVEIDKSAYCAVHDRAVIHFNVQHPMTKDYLLALPNGNPAECKSNIKEFEDIPLTGASTPTRSIETGASTPTQSIDTGSDNENDWNISVPNNNREDADACASDWGGASGHFRQSVKYVPNIQDCREAIKDAGCRLSDLENTEDENMKKHKTLGRKHDGGMDHFSQQIQGDNREACPGNCQQDHFFDLDEAKETGEAQKAANHQYQDNAATSFDEFQDEAIDDPFAQSTPVRQRTPVPTGEGQRWGAQPTFEGNQPVAATMHRSSFEVGDAKCDDSGHGTQPASAQTDWYSSRTFAETHHPVSPTEMPSLGAGPQTGWGNQQPHASDWSPERQNHVQSLRGWGQVNEPFPGASEFWIGPPVRSGRPLLTSNRYWSCRDPIKTETKTPGSSSSPPSNLMKEQRRADYDSDVTITDPSRPETDSNVDYNGPWSVRWVNWGRKNADAKGVPTKIASNLAGHSWGQLSNGDVNPSETKGKGKEKEKAVIVDQEAQQHLPPTGYFRTNHSKKMNAGSKHETLATMNKATLMQSSLPVTSYSCINHGKKNKNATGKYQEKEAEKVGSAW